MTKIIFSYTYDNLTFYIFINRRSVERLMWKNILPHTTAQVLQKIQLSLYRTNVKICLEYTVGG